MTRNKVIFWPTKKLGEKEYFEILGSGIERFEGEKEYLSTSSIEVNKIIAPECKITYQKRPSRANMQPRLNSVWFARMINTIKVYSFTEANKDEIDKYILSTGFAGILCNSEKVNPRYLEKIFLSKWFNDLKDSLASDKAIQKSLNNDDIANLGIPLPLLPIQQKIVKILDTIQSAVEIQEKIIEKTKELKKSLMAELFKYGGPSFRNPEPEQARYGARGRKLKKTETLNQSELGTGQVGEIPEDWEVVRLGDKNIAEIKYGKRKPPECGEIPVIGSSGIYDWTNKALIEKPTIVIGRKGTAGIPHLSTLPCWPSDTAFYLNLNLEKIDPKFLYEYILFKPLSGEHAKTTLPSLKREDLENFKIPLPPLPEQQEIAEILQTIDQKIEIEKKKKELYEELFKTMLNKIMSQEINVEKIEV
jgi:type I restriction enzyme S subunit